MAFRKMARMELVITPDTRLDDLWELPDISRSERHMLAVVIREDMETVADMVALTLPDGTWAEACDIRGFGSKCEQAARDLLRVAYDDPDAFPPVTAV